jgi:myo-inositol-1(or 4)-monophosphatase
MEYENELRTARGLVRDAAHQLHGKSGHVDVSTSRDSKLRGDRELHEWFLRQLDATPHPVLSEEGDPMWRGESGGAMWILDPIDGSVNFSRGIPLSVISLALWRGAEPVLGAIYDFHRDELYWGGPDISAHLGEQPIRVSTIEEPSDAVLCTGFPTGTDFDASALGAFVARIQVFKKVRLLGSAALSLAFVASGRADAYEERDIAIWDVAAGLAIVAGAGGQITIERSVAPNRHRVLVAGTSSLHERLVGERTGGVHHRTI